VGGQHYITADLPLGKSPVTPCIGGWVGLGVGLKGVREIWLPPSFEPKIVQAVESGSTYCSIPAAGNTVYIPIHLYIGIYVRVSMGHVCVHTNTHTHIHHRHTKSVRK
jgi:hypothetical protein